MTRLMNCLGRILMLPGFLFIVVISLFLSMFSSKLAVSPSNLERWMNVGLVFAILFWAECGMSIELAFAA